MQRKTVSINLEKGLEATPVAMLVQVASKYNSNIYMENDAKRVNCKSIMGMMSMALGNGERVTITTDGNDEEQAMSGMEQYLAKAN